MRRIYLNAGHRGGTTGANYNSIKEAEETIWLRNEIAKMLKRKGVEVEIDNDGASLSQVIATINTSCKPTDICVDLHFNAVGNPSANGTEVFKPFNSSDTEIEVAEDLLYSTCMVLNTKNRGVKREGEGTHQRLAMLSDIRCNSVLLEICFISNINDAVKYKEKRDELVIILAEQLIRHAHS
jgi:N-acetylmuramoyl-L-alanine amidase